MRVLILGLGLHGGGVGIANYFLKKGDEVIVTDLKSPDELEPSIGKLYKKGNLRLVLGHHDYKDIKNADLVIKNPAVVPDSPYIKYALEHGVRVDTAIGIFLDLVKAKMANIIGVTGTRGKSTTSMLIYEILRKHYPNTVVAGNITISVFDVLESIRKESYVVLELSSFQLGGIIHKRYSPPIAVITNFLEDHLNYYKNLDSYFEDKRVIYRYQNPGDLLIINRDNRVYKHVNPPQGVHIISFGKSEDFEGDGGFVKENSYYIRINGMEKEVCSLDRRLLPGEHNIYNIMAAASVAYLLEVEKSTIERIVSDFRGLEHRIEWVGTYRGIDIYNDSAATTPDAVIQAVRCFKGRAVTLIAGGSDKDLTLKKFIEIIKEKVQNLILLKGTGTERLIKQGLSKPYRQYETFYKAVRASLDITEPGGVILLSPGFASFGMFQNEFHRGREFKRIVKEIISHGE